MSEERWRPRSARETAAAAAKYDVLHDGVPMWLVNSLQTWAVDQMRPSRSSDWNEPLLRAIERNVRVTADWTRGAVTAAPSLLGKAVTAPEQFLDIIDFLLSQLKPNNDSHNHRAGTFDRQLEQGGSTWSVAAITDQKFGLVRRLAAPVEAAGLAAMEDPDPASSHLRTAWAEAYGRNPDPGKAYDEAVKAIEAAAEPVITPKDKLATLGKMIRAIKDAPAKWSVVFDGADDKQMLAIAELADMIWTAQPRHGTNDPNRARKVDQPEAEAAVQLAVMLVQWFRSGAVSPAP